MTEEPCFFNENSPEKIFSKNAIFFVTNLRFLRLTGEITKERLVDTWIRIPQKSYMKPFI
jgi:hypothetical protein